MTAGFRVTTKIEHAHALHPDYALYPGDLLVPEPDGRYTKEAPGLCITGFLLTAEEEATLQPVRFDHAGYPSTALLTAAAERYEREAAADRSKVPPAEPVDHDGDDGPGSDQGAAAPTAPQLTLVELMEWAENVGRADAMKARNRVARSVNSLRQLHQRVAVREAEKAAAKADVERLQAELAEARARLRRPAAAPAEGSHVCDHDDCGRPFKSKQGLSTHKTRAHGGS